MGIPATHDNDLSFAEQATTLSDEELLNLWEQSQRVLLALQLAMHGDAEARSGSEDAIICELIRRELRRSRRRTVTLAPEARPARTGRPGRSR